MNPIALSQLAPSNSPIGRYLADLEQKVKTAGVTLVFGAESTLPYAGQESIQVSGFFIENPTPTLAVATGKPEDEWLQILIHEGCHMDQYRENSAAWRNNTMPDGREAVDWLDQWCAAEIELDEVTLWDIVARAKQVELDCERRALAVIAEYGLPIDPADYARRANAYVHFYSHVAKIRRWNPPNEAPYQLPEVWKRAPAVLQDHLPLELEEAYNQAYPMGA